MIFRLSFLVLFVAFSDLMHADPGDTTWVQTYTWDAQNNPETAYDSPGRRWFEFPSGEDASYRKILMYHRLKCFEDGTAGNLGYPCGEWDYLTYNYLFDHTGFYDSTALTHPVHLINDADFEEASLILDPEGGMPVDTILWPLQVASHDFQGDSESWSQLAGVPMNNLLTVDVDSDVRHQWVWTAAELDLIAWAPGDSAWRMSLPRAGDLGAASVGRATLRARWSSSASLDGMVTSGWTTLVDAPIAVADFESEWALDFLSPLVRESEGNLMLDLVLSDVVGGGSMSLLGMAVEDTLGQTCAPSNSSRFIRMDGDDRMEIDPAALAGLDTTLTIECWLRGNEDVLPVNTTLFEAVNAANQRELNTHVPWSNSRVYWDCGFDGGYDRIDNAASEAQLEGRWVHWAFTKDAETGVMNIFVNGTLWHTGTNKDNVVGEIARMNLGSSYNGGVDYFGDVASFRMWDVALSENTIGAWMNKAELGALESHPAVDHLIGALNMEGENGQTTNQGALAGWIHGNPGRHDFNAREAFLDASPMDVRPALLFEGGPTEPISQITDAWWSEVVGIPPVSVTTWEVEGNDVVWTDLHYGWPVATVSSTLTALGDTLATHPIAGEVTVYNNDVLSYWSAPFEVIDRYELARYITPYGINLTLGPDGWAWVFDVTDYAPLLKDSVELECGNWQELLDLKFAFIEGTPPRDVENVTAFWKGTHYLNNWDETILPQTYTPGPNEEMWRLKTRASGHDFGQGNNCAEFCYNTHSVKVNDSPQWSWEIMQECADNPLYPQGGTWIYDRAGWCPGAEVRTQDFELTPLVNGDGAFSVEYDVTYDPHGNYRMEGQIIGYGAPNMAHDVELVDILSPNNDKLKSRFNPVCEDPVVLIRNTGSEPLTQVAFTYGISGTSLQTSTIELDSPLAFLETREVALPYDAVEYMVGDDDALLQFEVRADVADHEDEDPSNGWMYTTFRRPPTYQYPNLNDNRIIVRLKTNAVPVETTVEITKADGSLYWARSYSDPNTQHLDTLVLNEGCYRLTIYDSGDDGLSFWANNDGSGYCSLKRVLGPTFKNFEADFGKSISQAFYWATDVYSEVEEVPEARGDLAVYPNPAKDQLTLLPAGFSGHTQWRVHNAQGQLLNEGVWTAEAGRQSMLDASSWPSGTLVLVFQTEEQAWTKWIVKE